MAEYATVAMAKYATTAMAAMTAAQSVQDYSRQNQAARHQKEVNQQTVGLLQAEQARETQRRNKILAEASASQRARNGALGIGGGGGSGDAILQGMAVRTADENAESLDSLKRKMAERQDLVFGGSALSLGRNLLKTGLSYKNETATS